MSRADASAGDIIASRPAATTWKPDQGRGEGDTTRRTLTQGGTASNAAGDPCVRRIGLDTVCGGAKVAVDSGRACLSEPGRALWFE
jgi:hypothetical protein